MKAVLMVGAGFSKAFSDEMPLLRDLTAVACKAVCDVYPPERLSIPKHYLDNVEMLLSYLNEDYPWKSGETRLLEKACFLKASEAIAAKIRDAEERAFQSGIPEWARVLVRCLDAAGCSVITTNYDTVLERLAFVELQNWTPNLYTVPLTNAYGRWGVAILGGEQAETFHLFKLHGSINWFYTGSNDIPQPIYYVPVSESSPSKELEKAGNVVSDLVPLIVPPVVNKTQWSGRNSLLVRIWADAHRELSDADEIYVLGYSFPETDLAIRSLISSACGRKPQVVHPVNLVVDDDTIELYRRIFPGCSVGQAYQGSSAIADFVCDLSQRFQNHLNS